MGSKHKVLLLIQSRSDGWLDFKIAMQFVLQGHALKNIYYNKITGDGILSGTICF